MKTRKRSRLLFGVGINDSPYNVYKYGIVNGKSKVVWSCPFYLKWSDMLRRAYSTNLHNKRPTYIGCTVVEKWHTLSNFKTWMEGQDWQRKDLDKDLLMKNNKVYGPDTCIFIDPRVNTFLIERGNDRGEYPIGVTLHKSSGKYIARCMSYLSGKRQHLGVFESPEDAHKAWLDFKLEQARALASEQTDHRIAKALIERYENYTY